MSARTKPAPGPALTRHGFTLVELLVALVIAVLTAIAVVAMYGIATRTVTDQQARAGGPHAAAQVLDRMGEDLARAFLSTAGSNEFFRLENGGTQVAAGVSAVLSFCTLDPAQGGNPDWAGLRQVTYRLLEPGGALVREDQPLTGLGSVTGRSTNQLLAAVDTFQVELFDGAEWQSSWTEAPGDGRRPRLARITVGTQPGPSQSAEWLIPCGYSVTSRLIRSSTSADTP